jgi:hypothetical protein
VGGAVGTAAYAAGKHSGREQGYDEAGGYEEQGYDQPPQQAAPAQASPGVDYDQLARLGQLHADGTLTDEEFAAAKAKILGT